MDKTDQQFPGAKRRFVPILPFIPSHHSRELQSWDSSMEMEPPRPPPSGGHLFSGHGGKFQNCDQLPKAYPTTSLPVAEIGVGTTGFGIFFILFGILLYFDSVLLAFGNVSAPASSTFPTNLPEDRARRTQAPPRSAGKGGWDGQQGPRNTQNLRTWILILSSGGGSGVPA